MIVFSVSLVILICDFLYGFDRVVVSHIYSC